MLNPHAIFFLYSPILSLFISLFPIFISLHTLFSFILHSPILFYPLLFPYILRLFRLFPSPLPFSLAKFSYIMSKPSSTFTTSFKPINENFSQAIFSTPFFILFHYMKIYIYLVLYARPNYYITMVLRCFVMVCDGLRWFAMICDGFAMFFDGFSMIF